MNIEIYKEHKVSVDVYIKDALQSLEMYKWTMFRLDTERPAASLCHDWNVCKNRLGDALEDMKDAYKKASRKKNRKYSDTAIIRLEECWYSCGKAAGNGMVLLTRNEYSTNVVKERICELQPKYKRMK